MCHQAQWLPNRSCTYIKTRKCVCKTFFPHPYACPEGKPISLKPLISNRTTIHNNTQRAYVNKILSEFIQK